MGNWIENSIEEHKKDISKKTLASLKSLEIKIPRFIEWLQGGEDVLKLDAMCKIKNACIETTLNIENQFGRAGYLAQWKKDDVENESSEDFYFPCCIDTLKFFVCAFELTASLVKIVMVNDPAQCYQEIKSTGDFVEAAIYSAPHEENKANHLEKFLLKFFEDKRVAENYFEIGLKDVQKAMRIWYEMFEGVK